MKSPGLSTVKTAAILFSLAWLLTAIFASTAHAQGRYPPPYPPPPPQTYPNYPNPNYPPPQRSPPPGYPRSQGDDFFDPSFTFSLFVGTRFGGNIAVNTPNVDKLLIASSLNWGFNAGVRVVPHLFAEFMWNRQTTTLSAHDIPSNQIVSLTNHAHLDMYQASLLYEIWTRGPVRPFVVGGIGMTYFDSRRTAIAFPTTWAAA